MVDTSLQHDLAQCDPNFERYRELKAFDDTKAGVKGLVDAGITKIPSIFAMPPNEVLYKTSSLAQTQIQIPVIDLEEMQIKAQRQQIIEQIRCASETWGFFQVVNHGIPQDVLNEMIEGGHRFHEQPREMKMEFYSRDNMKKVKFNSNFDLYKGKAANWRDTLGCIMSPDAPAPEELPAVCREIIIKYSKQVQSLGVAILELLSEALGLEPNFLHEMECAKGQMIGSHYYPACPEPDKTLGTTPHTDADFFTILLQDQIGGLQVLNQNQWVDIQPVKGALVVNLGDLLQLISNDKFKSAQHRVVANDIGPRISVACFFTTHFQQMERRYGPIKELLSDDNPPLFRDATVREYVSYYYERGLNTSALDYFRL